ncbi:hypothetical protein EHM69_08340, partial [candidate division KSB1 bacterium]
MKSRTIWILCLTFALVASLTLGVYATYTARPELAKTSDAKRQNSTAVQTAIVTNSPIGKVVGRSPSMTSSSEAKPDVTAMAGKLIGPVAATR